MLTQRISVPLKRDMEGGGELYQITYETHHILAPLHLIPTVIQFSEGLTSTKKQHHIRFMPLAFMVRGGPP